MQIHQRLFAASGDPAPGIVTPLGLRFQNVQHLVAPGHVGGRDLRMESVPEDAERLLLEQTVRDAGRAHQVGGQRIDPVSGQPFVGLLRTVGRGSRPDDNVIQRSVVSCAADGGGKPVELLTIVLVVGVYGLFCGPIVDADRVDDLLGLDWQVSQNADENQ